ncbi:efflux RND transporter periplasmic adaptor subunit [Erwinia sp. V71]|uniref:efflux RND transporter periplasmic adaptor subunit n=1 Tax=Erwinia sp. V71 TaxID=3369424 RepID=UPI003F5E6861
MNRYQWLFSCFSVVFLSGCDQKSASEDLPRPILSMTAKLEQTQNMHLPGTVQARFESELAFQTMGRVISRYVDVGDLVHEGDVLAELDPLTLQLGVFSAEANLRDAVARQDIAVLTEKRRRALVSANAMSAENLELAEQEMNSAQSAVVQAKARLEKAREQLGYTKLRARFDGVISDVSVEAGQTVTAGQTTLRLSQQGLRDVVVDIPETQLADLHLGSRFDVSLQIDNTIHAVGTLREIAPETDASTRTRRLKIGIDGAPAQFRLGSMVTATPVKIDQSHDAIVLPATAIRQQEGGFSVWIIDPTAKTVSLRAVEIEAIQTGTPYVRIASGLHEGEDVAIAGVNVLTPGQKVRIERKPNQ